jgi:hypothetical protein
MVKLRRVNASANPEPASELVAGVLKVKTGCHRHREAGAKR